MIHISASLIKDFMDCPQKAVYRIYYPELSEATPEQRVGTLVHKVLEDPQTREVSLDRAHIMLLEEELLGHEAKIKGCINSYFDTFAEMTTPNDIVEYKFNINFPRDSYSLVGKFDRIVDKSVIIDWKTSTRVPRDLSKDIQFIVYQEAFKRLYGHNPTSMIYAALGADKGVQVHINKRYSVFVFEKLIPKILTLLSNTELAYKRGILDTNNVCSYCNFVRPCWEEEFKEDVLDN
jgi:CRISPR/Cas system-associated exonuclease Cas4 (RecB family)